MSKRKTINLDTATKTELRALCKTEGVKGYGKLTSDSMRAALRALIETDPNYPTSVPKDVAPVVTTPASAPVSAPAPVELSGRTAPERETRNGVKRPAPGGLCAQVWDFCDHVARTEGEGAVTAAVIKQAAEDKGLNQSNASIEMYQWKRFMGLTQLRAKKPKSKGAAKAAPPAMRVDGSVDGYVS